MPFFDSIASWLSSVIAGPLSKIHSVIDDAIAAARNLVPNLDVPTFVDMYRESMREGQFTDMLANPDTPQLVKDTEYLESDYTLPRNYVTKFFVQYIDETTGEMEEGYRSMYSDQRLSNSDLIDTFLSIDRGPEYNPKGKVSFITVDTVKHSKGSPYGQL